MPSNLILPQKGLDCKRMALGTGREASFLQPQRWRPRRSSQPPLYKPESPMVSRERAFGKSWPKEELENDCRALATLRVTTGELVGESVAAKNLSIMDRAHHCGGSAPLGLAFLGDRDQSMGCVPQKRARSLGEPSGQPGASAPSSIKRFRVEVARYCIPCRQNFLSDLPSVTSSREHASEILSARVMHALLSQKIASPPRHENANRDCHPIIIPPTARSKSTAINSTL